MQILQCKPIGELGGQFRIICRRRHGDNVGSRLVGHGDLPHERIYREIVGRGRRDGIEAALEMFNACGVRCIFATAHHDPGTRARAAKAAPLGWLPKPYQLDGLISMINAAVTELKKSRS